MNGVSASRGMLLKSTLISGSASSLMKSTERGNSHGYVPRIVISTTCRPLSSWSGKGPASHVQISKSVQGIELNRWRLAGSRYPMQFATFDIEASHVGRAPRDDDPAIVFLSQALQTGACIHRFANGGNDLRGRRSHRADDSLAGMNANSDPQRLRQVSPQSAVELVHARQHFAGATQGVGGGDRGVLAVETVKRQPIRLLQRESQAG
jgi:hypothetical protein